ncbi:phospholipid-binding protein MlaC [Thermodesulfobacteriota bacterium]
MKNFYFMTSVLVSLFLLSNTSLLRAGGPEEKIKHTTHYILSVVNDPDLKHSDKTGDRKGLIRKAVDERFDWEEISRRSLGKHWKELTDNEKQEFVFLFSRLLERTYLEKLENFSGEKVYYEKEVIEGVYGSVEMKIMTSKGVPIQVKYNLRKKEDDWLVYDVYIGGVSLVNNYRNQFNNILRNSSYKTLAEKLKDKVAEK